MSSRNSSNVVSLTAILALTSLARGAEINNDNRDADGGAGYQSYDAKQSNVRAQRYHQNHGSTRQRRIAHNKQRRLVNRRRRISNRQSKVPYPC